MLRLSLAYQILPRELLGRLSAYEINELAEYARTEALGADVDRLAVHLARLFRSG